MALVRASLESWVLGSYFMGNSEGINLIESGILCLLPASSSFTLSLCIAMDSVNYFLVEFDT